MSIIRNQHTGLLCDAMNSMCRFVQNATDNLNVQRKECTMDENDSWQKHSCNEWRREFLRMKTKLFIVVNLSGNGRTSMADRGYSAVG